jgi:hypothetical protein
MLHDVEKALANQAPSTHDPSETLAVELAVMHNGYQRRM